MVKANRTMVSTTRTITASLASVVASRPRGRARPLGREATGSGSKGSLTMHYIPRLLIGITGSINAVSMVDYLHALASVANEIRCILTKHAQTIVNPDILRLYTEVPPYTSLWDSHGISGTPHVYLADWADVMVVLPATANCIGKAAAGIADDLLSTTLIAYRESVLFAPAMNRRMWENPVIKRNVATLQDLGHIVLDPQTAISVTQSSSGAVGPNMKELVRAAKYLSMRSLRRERLG